MSHDPKRLRVEDYYIGNSGLWYRNVHLGVASDAVYSAVARQRARKLSPYVEAVDRVFEYGVGNGFNLAALPCAERVGHDLFNGGAEIAQYNISFCADTASLASGYFDVALCLHTLEHVSNPCRFTSWSQPEV